MQLIILTAEQADAVRGETSEGAMLMPRLLADGRFILPLEVLVDPAHDCRRELLASYPIGEVDAAVLAAPEAA